MLARQSSRPGRKKTERNGLDDGADLLFLLRQVDGGCVRGDDDAQSVPAGQLDFCLVQADEVPLMRTKTSAQISAEYADCDGPYGTPGPSLKIPDNLTLVHLPAYSPELNAAYMLWRKMR